MPKKTARRTPAPTVDTLIARRLLYPISEAARLLGRHRVTLYKDNREGRIQLVRVGGRTYVRAEELDRFVAEAQPVAS